jgi:hypothetical protein
VQVLVVVVGTKKSPFICVTTASTVTHIMCSHLCTVLHCSVHVSVVYPMDSHEIICAEKKLRGDSSKDSVAEYLHKKQTS